MAVPTKNAETIVLIHSNVTDHSLFDRIVPYFRNHFHIIRYDLAGLGLSELGNETISFDLHMEDFGFLVESLELSPFYIFAIGFGGFVALEYSKIYKKMVKKMVLMTMPCFPEETFDAVLRHQQIISFGGTQIPVHHILKKVTLLAEDDPEYIRLYNMMSRQSVTTYTKMMELMILTNTVDYLKNNSIPTLILAGEYEIIFPQNLLIANCAFIPGHKYAVVPNASSFLMIDQPEITAKLAIEHFKSYPSERYNDDVSTSISNDIRLYTQNYFHSTMKSTQETNVIQIDFLYSFKVMINKKAVIHGLNQRYAKNILIFLLFHPITTREEICENLWRLDSLGVYLNGELKSDLLTLQSNLQKVSFLGNQKKYVLAKNIMKHFHSSEFFNCDF